MQALARPIVTGFALAAALSLATPAGAAPIPIANAGFETPEVTFGTSIPTGLPTQFADWEGDNSAIVGAEQGVSPLDGAGMLRFISSQNSTTSWGLSSDVWQLVDMTPYLSAIATGTATATLSAHFNRVAGDDQTEPLFVISIRAFAGSPLVFPDVAELPLGDASSLLWSDADVTSWEYLSATLSLPSATTYLAIRLAARETIDDSPIATEFVGHYADGVALQLHAVPEPGTVILCSSGLLTIIARCRRRRSQ